MERNLCFKPNLIIELSVIHIYSNMIQLTPSINFRRKMSLQDNCMHEKFGIDEIYIHSELSNNLLDKLYQRSVFSLDAEDSIVRKFASHDMVLIFHKLAPKQSLIYRFLEFIHQDKNRDIYIKNNILINEEELFLAIKSKKFILVTHRTLEKETYSPMLCKKQ